MLLRKPRERIRAAAKENGGWSASVSSVTYSQNGMSLNPSFSMGYSGSNFMKTGPFLASADDSPRGYMLWPPIIVRSPYRLQSSAYSWMANSRAGLASSQGGFVGGDTWNSTSNHLNGAGFTAAGAEYSGSRALTRTMKYVSTASKTTPTEVMFKVPGGSVYASTRFVSNATKVLKVGGAATGVLGVGMTGYEIYTGQKSLMGEGGLDLIMGGVAFIPGGGWIVSGAYFGGKYLLEATGNDFWNEP